MWLQKSGNIQGGNFPMGINRNLVELTGIKGKYGSYLSVHFIISLADIIGNPITEIKN